MTTLALLVCLATHARQPNPDAVFAPWDKPATPGMAVAVLRDGVVVYAKGFGTANLELRTPISPATAFNIGSVSKQFTAFAVLLLAKDGKLSLDDPVRKHVPEFPDFGTPLTVRHLIHHTSGLREDWSLLAMSGTRSEDVIRTPDILRLVGRQKELNFAPGSEYLYCNTGYDMLAEVVKRASGKSLRVFARDRMFAPAGMKATEFCDDYRMLVPNKATSYRLRLGGFEHSLFATERAGPSNLFTTVEDMARWVVFTDKLAKSDPELAAAMTRRGKLNNGTELSYAAGLIVGTYRGTPLVSHGGSTAGYRATLHRYPEHHLAVVIASNVSTTNPDELASRVADLYLGDKLQPKSGPKKPADAPPPKAKPFAPMAGALPAFAGKFYSEELEVLYTVAVRDGQLRIAHPKGENALRAAKPDEFTATGADTVFDTIAFTRNAAGTVTGFKISTPRARNVRFAKVEIKPVGP